MQNTASLKEWYIVDNADEVDSPALLVYPDRVKNNIRLLQNMMPDNNMLRPHVKTNKMAEVCRMMMDAGITKFKCATIAEAEMLGIIGAPDVLLAYQPVGPKVLRLINLIKAYPSTQFSCLADNANNLEYISSLAGVHRVTIPVLIDLNVGMNRTGIKPGDALELAKLFKNLTNLKLVGLHAYDGHIRDTDLAARKLNCDEAFNSIRSLQQHLEAQGQRLIIVAGGTPTFPIHAQRGGVECSPGTFVFTDWGYKHLLPDEAFDFAALVLSRVISIVDYTTICTDLGHKSVAAENPLPRVHFLNAPGAQPVGQSEEHLVLRVEDATQYKVGDILYGVPVHICPTVALYGRANIIRNNMAVDTWKVIARERAVSI